MSIDSILRGLIGLIVLLFLSFLFSNNRRSIDWRLVATGMILQFLFAFLVLKSWIGREIFNQVGKGFVFFFSFAGEGAQFVFGPLAKSAEAQGGLGFIFAFQVLPTIIFFAAFMAVMYHLGVMQRVVQGMAWIIIMLMRVSGAEALVVAAATFIGQTETPLVIRPYLARLTRSELFTVMTSGMAHIAGGVMAAYVLMLGGAYARAQGAAADPWLVYFAGHLLAACIMAAPATFVVAKMLFPEKESPETMGTIRVKIEKSYANVIEAAAGGASEGVRLALNVAGMLIAFIAIIALCNWLLTRLGDATGVSAGCAAAFGKPLSLELLFGLLFQFIAFTIGVPWQDALNVGSLMGIKLVLNEFVAYSKMADMVSAKMLSDKAIVIATYSLCGFANFSSIAIQIGGISPLAENRRAEIARFGLKAVLGGTLATWMTAAVAGMLY